MIVRSLDATGDWTFGKGRNNYLAANKAIVQSISTRLNSFLGDCFFALDQGLDWFNLLGAKDQLALQLAIRAVILNTDGVVSIVDVSANIEENTRRISIKYRVDTIYTVSNQTPPVSGVTSYLLTEDGSVLTTEDGSGLIAG